MSNKQLKKQIPIKVEDQRISAEGLIELKHDLNFSNTFTVILPKVSSIEMNDLQAQTDSIDIEEYTTIDRNSKNGTFTFTIDNEALAERFKGLDEQDLVLSLTAFAKHSPVEEFQVHFKFLSNIVIEQNDDSTIEATSSVPAEDI